MSRTNIGYSFWLPLLLLACQRATGTPTAPPSRAGGQVIGATSLAATQAAVFAATTTTTNNNNNKKRHNDIQRNQLADLMPANLLLEDLQQSNGQLINLTRHHDGDIFYTSGKQQL